MRANRHDLYKRVDATYYGYLDEDDGALLAAEAEAEKKRGGTISPWSGVVFASPSCP